MSERFDTKRCIKALYKYSSFPFLIVDRNKFIVHNNQVLRTLGYIYNNNDMN